MKTSELLSASEAELVPQLRVMKAKELERHAEKLLKKLGADYPTILAAITKAIPGLSAAAKTADTDAFAQIQNVIRHHAKTGADNPLLLERVAVIMSIIIKKQFLKIHQAG